MLFLYIQVFLLFAIGGFVGTAIVSPFGAPLVAAFAGYVMAEIGLGGRPTASMFLTSWVGTIAGIALAAMLFPYHDPWRLWILPISIVAFVVGHALRLRKARKLSERLWDQQH